MTVTYDYYCYRFTIADPESNEPRTEFNPYDERHAAKIKENPALEVPDCKVTFY